MKFFHDLTLGSIFIVKYTTTSCETRYTEFTNKERAIDYYNFYSTNDIVISIQLFECEELKNDIDIQKSIQTLKEIE